MAELEGNCLVGQSGGPTAVINATLAGVIEEALNYECIEEIYGSLNGVMGILNEDFVDLASESQQAIRGSKALLVLLWAPVVFSLRSRRISIGLSKYLEPTISDISFT